MDRACTKCGITKSGVEFYSYADGRPMAQCKSCVKARVRQHRAANADRIRAYDRERSSLPHRVAKRREIFESYKAANPERRAAHCAVNNAVRGGQLVRQPCAFCGSSENLEAHHHDYSKPLDVTWLCTPCHRKFHGLERMATYREERAA